MRKVSEAWDMSGRALTKGDTVSTANGALTGRVSDLAEEEGAFFVCVRPIYQPYGRGVWHAADRVIYVASGQRNRKKG
jgi:hypothetical protein